MTWLHRRSYANDAGGGGCTAIAAIGRRESGAGGAQAAHLWALAQSVEGGAAFKLTLSVRLTPLGVLAFGEVLAQVLALC